MNFVRLTIAVETEKQTHNLTVKQFLEGATSDDYAALCRAKRMSIADYGLVIPLAHGEQWINPRIIKSITVQYSGPYNK